MNGTICHRVTFSKSVAALIAETAGMSLLKGTVQEGKLLQRGEKSSSGFYAICSKKKVLRVAMSQDIAELLCDYDSRYVAEAFISPRHG